MSSNSSTSQWGFVRTGVQSCHSHLARRLQYRCALDVWESLGSLGGRPARGPPISQCARQPHSGLQHYHVGDHQPVFSMECLVRNCEKSQEKASTSSGNPQYLEHSFGASKPGRKWWKESAEGDRWQEVCSELSIYSRDFLKTFFPVK